MARPIDYLMAYAVFLVGTTTVGGFAWDTFGWFGWVLWLVICFQLGVAWGRIFSDVLRSRGRWPL